MKEKMKIGTWTLVEVYGTWWAYQGSLKPADREFVTHHRNNRNIIGPFHGLEFAKGELERRRSR